MAPLSLGNGRLVILIVINGCKRVGDKLTNLQGKKINFEPLTAEIVIAGGREGRLRRTVIVFPRRRKEIFEPLTEEIVIAGGREGRQENLKEESLYFRGAKRRFLSH